MKKYIFLLFVIIFFTSCKNAKKVESKVLDAVEANFSVEILDNEALDIINTDTNIKILASGFTWTEGPLWVEEGKYLLFSDIPNNKVYKLNKNNDTITYLTPAGCDVENFTKEKSGSNGLLLNPEGKLVLMQQGDRRVGVMNAPLSTPKESYTSLVNNFEGKRLNSPNDGVYDAAGNLYFTDPPYGLPNGAEDASKELDYQGVYCLLKTGELLLLDKLTRPNGITLSPDEKVLYVAVSDPEHAVWYRYDITTPGEVKNKDIFYDCTSDVGNDKHHVGLPDGMKTNSKGYVFATGPGGVWVFNKLGKPLARIYTGQATSNCALSTNEKRLFITADDYILEVNLK